jgi:DNA-binding response OmpR family regulator
MKTRRAAVISDRSACQWEYKFTLGWNGRITMQLERKILVIDDNELILSALKILLEYEGFKVQTCPGAASALALAKGQAFDVFIVDYQLPDMNGDAVTAAIRKMHPSSIIIGSSVEPKERAFLSAGADTFIIKHELPAAVSALIRSAPCASFWERGSVATK